MSEHAPEQGGGESTSGGPAVATGEVTGEGPAHAAVAAARARLEELADAPVSSHPEVYDDVHRRLQDSLATLDGI